ncbi:MAG TPA: dihydrodipicolinate synthase family protein [Gemmatimonadaceae bacterium]|nr:dihydrodipicolinate synthase family protein [Gemmatimonadaceae bacterium]
MRHLVLPRADGTLEAFALHDPKSWPHAPAPFRARIAFAAAHVVCDPLRDVDVLTQPAIDWDATLAYRRHLWRYGFAVAEAMDTAQRGGGLDWSAAQDLIARSLAEARNEGGMIACGAGTDHLSPQHARTLADVERAYAEQVSFVERHGGRVILMASRALAGLARSADDYARIYGDILRQAREPVIIHWLGDMFDPALAGYWGSRDVDAAMDTCLAIIGEHRSKVDGVKISLLDAQREIEMRRRLPQGVRMYTGDDFNFAELIEGDATHHSDALLGILDAIAPAASVALQALDAGDVDCYHRTLAPTVPLSRHIFRAPTYAYKTGIVFLAYLNGHQSHFRMLGGAESARSAVHLAEIIRLADAAGLLADPALAAARARVVFAAAGIT